MIVTQLEAQIKRFRVPGSWFSNPEPRAFDA